MGRIVAADATKQPRARTQAGPARAMGGKMTQDLQWIEEIAQTAGVEPDALIKAYRQAGHNLGGKAHDLDTQQLSSAVEVDGTIRPMVSLPFDLVRQIAQLSDVIGAIISTRVLQVSAFAVPQRQEFEPGYQIRLKSRTKHPTRAQQRRIQEVSDWLDRCGDPRCHVDPFNTHFAGFTEAVIRDSLTLDWAVFECIPTRGGGLAGFVPVDAATIRRASPETAERKEGRFLPGDLKFVQVVQNKIVERFDPGDLVVGVRRQRTDLAVFGYGFPEIEQILRKIIQLLLAETYNASNFTQGIHARGIMTVESAMGAKDWNSFLRNARAMLSGAANANKLAFVQLKPGSNERINFTDLFRNNKDMEYSNWTNWLLKVSCAVFAIDPAELGFVFGNEGTTSTLSERGPAERLAYSREKGLRSLLTWYERLINRAIISRVDPELELVFVGLDGATEADRSKAEQQDVSYIKTVNEVRATRDLPPIKGGDAILNTYFLQSLQGEQAQEQAAAGGGLEGGPAAAGEPGAGPSEGGGPVDQGGGEDFDVDALFGRSALTSKGKR